jgi:hypothetical protein
MLPVWKKRCWEYTEAPCMIVGLQTDLRNEEKKEGVEEEVWVSSKTGEGMEELWKEILRHVLREPVREEEEKDLNRQKCEIQ